MAHLMGLHLQIPRGAHTNAEQSGQGALSDHMISPSPFDQTDGDDGSQMHPDVTALTATKIINLTKVSINKNLRQTYVECLKIVEDGPVVMVTIPFKLALEMKAPLIIRYYCDPNF